MHAHVGVILYVFFLIPFRFYLQFMEDIRSKSFLPKR